MHLEEKPFKDLQDQEFEHTITLAAAGKATLCIMNLYLFSSIVLIACFTSLQFVHACIVGNCETQIVGLRIWDWPKVATWHRIWDRSLQEI